MSRNQFAFIKSWSVGAIILIGISAIPSESFGQPPIRGLNSTRTAQAVPYDRDRDGLTDTEEIAAKTDPRNPDTDGDALLDGWEVYSVNGVNLKALGASPLHKDIFVEMDYMVRASATNKLMPDAAVLQEIVSVFANAPVSNPDGSSGIAIHLEMGNEVPYDSNLSPLFTEFAAIKEKNFDPNRAPVFHYMIWANTYDSGSSSGYSLNIPHSDFVVTLGSWHGNQGGTKDEKIGTFIHELGHNLGRMHGGSEHVNQKPNHLSVMSYTFQTRGIRLGNTRVFDYQRFPLPKLNELALREEDGLCAGVTENYYTIFNTLSYTLVESPCGETLDWSGDGRIDSSVVSVDLNDDSYLTELLSTPNEWAQIIYNGGAVGSTDSIKNTMIRTNLQFERLPFVELSEELNKQIQTSMK